MRRHRRPAALTATGRKRLAAGLAGVAALAGASATAAAYTDHALLTLGSGAQGFGVGNPNVFDIAVRDAQGGSRDAQTEADALVLTLPQDARLAEATATDVDVVVVNRDTSMAGDLLLRVYDPDPEQGDPWAALRFTITLDGVDAPVISGASADQVNAAGIVLEDVAAGQSRQVRISVVLAQGTSAALSGERTGIGVRFEGESR